MSKNRLQQLAGGLRRACPKVLRQGWMTGLIVGVLLLWGWTQWTEASRGAHTELAPHCGEALLHGLTSPQWEGQISWGMPLASVAQTLMHNHMPPAARYLWLELLAAASILLVFALGRLLHSNLCGLLAVLAAVLFRLVMPTETGQILYVPLVLLAACLTVWRLRSPGMGRSLVLGASIGMSLLVRSPLFLFPFALAALEWILHRRRPNSKHLSRVWVVCAVPFALLLPWIYMNWRIHGRFIPFEDGRASMNVIAGALGFVEDMGSSRIQTAFGIERGEVLSWAAVEILTHPLRYLSAFCLRLWFVFMRHPLLMALGALSLWWFRKREEHLQIGLLTFYFVGIHCLMAVEPSYFQPIWPVFAVLAAALFAELLSSGRDRNTDRLPMSLVWAIFLPAACMSLFVLSLAAAYPHRRDGSRAALGKALAKNPQDAWLWSERGHRRMRAGRIHDATKDFAKAYALAQDKERELDYAWGLMLRGTADSDLIERVQADVPWLNWRVHAIRLLGRLRGGRGREAREAFKSMHLAFVLDCYAYRNRTPREKPVQDMLCEKFSETAEKIIPLAAPLPSKERWRIVDKLLNFPGMNLVTRIQAAEAAADDGNRKAARRALSQVSADSLNDKEKERLLRLYARLGERGRALKLTEELVSRPAKNRKAGTWLNLALLAHEIGDSALLRRILARAQAAGPTPVNRAAMARFYTHLGDFERALKLAQPLVDRSAKLDSKSWVDVAFTAQTAGNSPLAREALSRAQAAGPAPEERVAIARFYAQAGDFKRAMRITRTFADRSAKLDSKSWLNLALAAQTAGNSPLARKALARAQSAGPAPEERASIAQFYAQAGDFKRAMQITRSLLERPARLPFRSWLKLASAAELSGGSRAALRALRRARESGPSAEQKRLIAIQFQNMKRYDRALGILDELIAAQPRDPRNWNSRGVVKALMGRKQEAIKDLKVGVGLKPLLPEACLTLGGLLTSLGKKQEAAALYDRLLAENPALAKTRMGLIIRQERGRLTTREKK